MRTLIHPKATADEILEAAIAVEHEAETFKSLGLRRNAAILNTRAQTLRALAKTKRGSAK